MNKPTMMICGALLASCVSAANPSAKPTAKTPPAKSAVTPAAKLGEFALEESNSTAKARVGLSKGAKGTDGKNALVDIECDDATLAEIIRQYRQITGANIICGETSNLLQRVSVSLHGVPWMESLQSILNTRSFRLEPRGDIYFVSAVAAAKPTFTRTYQLNHASADELTALFNTSYGTKDRTGKLIHGIATSFPGANAIVVTADEETLAACEGIIKAVDKAVAQIYIEARFIEASSEALHRLGVQWNALESWGATVHGLSAGIEYNNGRVNTFKAGKSVQTSQSTASDGTSSSSSQVITDYLKPDRITAAPGAGRTGSSNDGDDMNWRNARGFSGQLSVEDFSLALSAFESMSDVKVFSNPKIIVANGKEATVDMTTKFPNVRVQATRNTSNGSDSFDISTQLEVIPGEDKLMFAKEAFYSWGITLSVKPRISPDGLINVEIIPTISQLDDSAITAGTGFYKVSGGDSSAYSSYPVIQVKRLTTDFTMKDGATAVIGGLSKTTEEDIDSGIPFLRKIPWIGPKLFGWKSRGKVQKEIIVFVTIGIADPGHLRKDIGLPKNAVFGREYVNGLKLEPGDRRGNANNMLKLDTRPMDERPDPVAKPVAKPTAKPAPKPAPVAKPVAKPTVKPIAKPAPVKAQPPSKPAPAPVLLNDL